MAAEADARALARSEDAAWAELTAAVEILTDDDMELPGYRGDWSVKDLLAHIGCWQAEAVQALEALRFGTYVPLPHDVEELNRRFREATRDLPLPIVRAEVAAARTRMLQEWSALPEVTPEAEAWFRESGPEHYREHLPRLREWVSELRPQRGEA